MGILKEVPFVSVPPYREQVRAPKLVWAFPDTSAGLKSPPNNHIHCPSTIYSPDPPTLTKKKLFFYEKSYDFAQKPI